MYPVDLTPLPFPRPGILKKEVQSDECRPVFEKSIPTVRKTQVVFNSKTLIRYLPSFSGAEDAKNIWSTDDEIAGYKAETMKAVKEFLSTIKKEDKKIYITEKGTLIKEKISNAMTLQEVAAENKKEKRKKTKSPSDEKLPPYSTRKKTRLD
ncbi:MAG: hypothetical protein V4489_10225 [Chlamydiota bacterium]